MFSSYLQSKEDESDGENDELVQVMMLDWQLAFTCRLCYSLFANSNDCQLIWSCCWSGNVKCIGIHEVPSC